MRTDAVLPLHRPARRGLAAGLLLGAAGLCAQAPVAGDMQQVWRHYQVRHGLPQSSVNAIVQDQTGFLWLATYGGLARFDGLEFRVSGAQAGLGSQRIMKLLQGGDGTLWVGTEDAGLYRGRDGRFMAVDLCAQRCRIFDLEAAPGYGVYVATGGALARVAADGTVGFEATPLPDVLRVAARADGWLAVADAHAVQLRDPAGRWRAIADAQVHTIQQLRLQAQELLVLSNQLVRVTLPDGRAQPLLATPLEAPIYDLADDAGQRWLATARGLYRMRGDHAQPVPESPQAVLSALTVDREQNLWVGSDGEGLARIRRSAVEVVGAGRGILEQPVMTIEADPAGHLWFGQLCGPLVELGGTGLVVHALARRVPGGDCVSSLHADADGLWIGMTGESRLLHWRRQRPVAVFQLPDASAYEAIQALHRTGPQQLYVGSSKGLYLFDGHRAVRVPGAPDASIAGIGALADGRLWLTSSKGFHLRQADGHFQTLPQLQRARGVYQDTDGTVWVGTYGNGLYRIDLADPTLGTVHRYGRDDGLYEDIASCVLGDGAGRLWISGNRGIYALGLEALAQRLHGGPRLRPLAINEDDGMRNAETNGRSQPRCQRTADGRLWFPTVAGAVAITPDQLLGDDTPPLAFIDGVLIDGVETALPATGGTLAVPASAVNLVLRYGAISLRAPERLRFRYRIPEVSESWIDAGSLRSVSLPLLPTGSFRLEVVAIDAAGKISTQPALLAVDHPQRWYRRSSTLLVGTVLLAAYGMALARWRIQRLRQRTRQLDQQVLARTTELREALGELDRLARTDALTGLANTRQLQRHLDTQLAAARPFAVLMLDVDHFKQYNDHFGHLAGDDCLRRIAGELARASTDGLAARYAGDEFLLVWPVGAEHVTARLDALLQAIRALAIAHAPASGARWVSVSVGVTCVDTADPRDAQALLQAADLALYARKAAGRDGWSVHGA